MISFNVRLILSSISLFVFLYSLCCWGDDGIKRKWISFRSFCFCSLIANLMEKELLYAQSEVTCIKLNFVRYGFPYLRVLQILFRSVSFSSLHNQAREGVRIWYFQCVLAKFVGYLIVAILGIILKIITFELCTDYFIMFGCWGDNKKEKEKEKGEGG